MREEREERRERELPVKALLREPFFHFLVVGALLFGAYAFLSGETGLDGTGGPGGLPAKDGMAIEVSRDELLAFVQNRTKEPDAEVVARAFAALDAKGRQAWVERFVREEALVREARKLGLDRDDALIRRRLVQQMEFLAEGAVPATAEISEADLEAHYVQEAAAYQIPAALTFTHVFVKEAGEYDSSGERAQMLVGKLNRDGVTFREAMPLGDRFLYSRNYVNRTRDEVESHFGADFTDRMMALPVPREGEPPAWSGPYQSEHGWHLVLLRRREDARQPEISEVAPRLREEIRRARREAGLKTAVDEIVSGYRVAIDPTLGADWDSAQTEADVKSDVEAEGEKEAGGAIR